MFAVEFHDVSKIYRRYEKPFHRLKEVILRRPYHSPFIALQDISFSVFKGEALGIIGENGAGKSTLLKILAGTLSPTSGIIRKNGRIAALLELGAGFHPDFTGRQNIYINTSLLGMGKEETASCEEDIVRFAELEDFIDQPVKTYSSGMYVRLAFSIATTIDPDILIIDEALSVGDRSFQKKCIDRMVRFRQSGKTIIFCSHGMYHVTELCDNAIWLKNGRIHAHGEKNRIVGDYENWCLEKEREKAPGMPVEQVDSLPIVIQSVKVLDTEESEVAETKQGDDLTVVVEVESKEEMNVHVGVGIRTIGGENIFGISTKGDGLSTVEVKSRRNIRIEFTEIQLISGKYQAFGILLDEHALHVYHSKFSRTFDVRKSSEMIGMLYMPHQWSL